MALLQRITTPFAALLPDLNNVPQQRQAVGAIVASLILHLLFFLVGASVWTVWTMATAKFSPVEFAQPKMEPEPLELTVMDLSPPKEEAAELLTQEELQARARLAQIDSTGLTPSTEKPKEALFESDVDMKAGSELPATGNLPLPSQEGRDLPGANFKNQDVILGSLTKPPTAEMQPAAPPQPTAPPTPVEPKAEEAAAEPATKPKENKPVPAPEVLTPNEQEIAVTTKMTEVPEGPVTRLTPAAPAFRTRQMPHTPAPKVQPAPPTLQDHLEMAKLSTPTRPVPESGFQEQQIKTRVAGGITDRGRPGVDAVKTPLGVYMKNVRAAISSRWYYYLRQHQDRYSFGSVEVDYAITEDGKITNVRVLSNTSNSAFAMLCEQCLREAEIAPPPDEAQAAMNDGKLEESLTFTFVAPL